MSSESDRYGAPVHYSAVSHGTPVIASDGREVGSVDAVIDNYSEHIFDGLVIERQDGSLAFCDAPEVDRTLERAITLRIDSAQVAQLPTPERAAPEFSPRRGALAKVLGGWRKSRR